MHSRQCIYLFWTLRVGLMSIGLFRILQFNMFRVELLQLSILSIRMIWYNIYYYNADEMYHIHIILGFKLPGASTDTSTKFKFLANQNVLEL